MMIPFAPFFFTLGEKKRGKDISHFKFARVVYKKEGWSVFAPIPFSAGYSSLIDARDDE